MSSDLAKVITFAVRIVQCDNARGVAAPFALVHQVGLVLSRRVGVFLELFEVGQFPDSQQVVGIRSPVVIVRRKVDAGVEICVRDKNFDHILKLHVRTATADVFCLGLFIPDLEHYVDVVLRQKIRRTQTAALDVADRYFLHHL